MQVSSQSYTNVLQTERRLFVIVVAIDYFREVVFAVGDISVSTEIRDENAMDISQSKVAYTATAGVLVLTRL